LAVFDFNPGFIGLTFAAHKPLEQMKSPLSLLFAAMLAVVSGTGWAGPFSPDVSDTNYVVIGAFADADNAHQFTRIAQTRWPAACSFNAGRNLYYVYVLQTGNRAEAIAQARQLRESSPYRDAWVYRGSLAGPAAEPVAVNENRATAEPALPLTPAAAPTAASQPVELPQQPAAVPTNSGAQSANVKNVLFRIFREGTDLQLEGKVDVTDADTDRRKGTYPGNVPVQLREVGPSGNVSAACEVFGYRKAGLTFNLKEPAAGDGITEKDGVIHVPFALVRLKKGDIQVLYHVLFFKDAAIMRPESRTEVNALRDMLTENPKLKIRIHGHTNGNASGKIIKPGTTDLFSLSQSKETFGSAKKLSESRAEVIKSFLVSEGIDPARLEVKAWGGKRPLYDKLHSQAQLNVRVEIEVISD
jgi:outer membrane protein OmpA-like peptidoglycan-associated protein